MKYLVMIYSNPASRAAWEGFSDADKAAGLRVYASLLEELADSGELVASEALADPSHGRRPFPADGRSVEAAHARRPVSADGRSVDAGHAPRPVSADGPFAEVKEHLAGFFLVDCASMERALEIAARIPEAPYGLVEVRPTMTYDGMDVG